MLYVQKAIFRDVTQMSFDSKLVGTQKSPGTGVKESTIQIKMQIILTQKPE